MRISTPLGEREFQEATVKYSMFPALREIVRALLNDLARRESLTLFGSVCGRCGRCCSTMEVIAESDELFAMALHLGIRERELIEKFTVPAATWNPDDRALRREEGRCVFLRPLPHCDAPDAKSECAIYKVRPRRCAATPASMPICRKRPGDLIEYIENIELSGGFMKVKSYGLGGFILPLLLEPWGEYRRRILEEASSVEGAALDKVQEILDKARTTLRELERRAPGEGTVEGFRRSCGEMREVLASLEAVAGDDPAVLEEIRALRKRAEGLGSDLMCTPPADAHASTLSVGGRSYTALHVFPEGLALTRDGAVCFSTPLAGDLLERTRIFASLLVRLESHGLTEVLKPGSIPCYMCGKCCSVLAVEIDPSDVERLAENLGITETEFRAGYTEPPRFGWNEGSAMLSKKPRSDGADGCPFLGAGTIPDLWYCTVHEFKPALCRSYSTRHDPCRAEFDERYPLGRLGIMTALRIDDDAVHVETRTTAGRETLVRLDDHPEIRAAARSLLDALGNVIESRLGPKECYEL
jgi:Fe-S-cluster containining protein